MALDDPYLRILQQAANLELPVDIDSTSMADWPVVRDLMQSGQLQGVVTGSAAGTRFSSVSITPKGRDFLRRRQARAELHRGAGNRMMIRGLVAAAIILTVTTLVALTILGTR